MANNSRVRRPKWTGTDGECAVVVSRGEPRRTDREMWRWLDDQVHAYLAAHGDEQDAGVAAAAAQLIMADRVWPEGSQGVFLTREHVLAYAVQAREKLATNGYFEART
jgi:hypothetical protein